MLPPCDGMDALRTLTSALSHYDPDASDNSPQASTRKAVRLTAQLGTLVATIGRLNAGGGPIQPDPVLGHAANFLYMLTGERPSGAGDAGVRRRARPARRSRAQCLHFCGARRRRHAHRLHSAIVGAIGALKGPLHGGANADVMRLLLEIGSSATADRVEAVIRGKLARKEKIPGFGHRVYHTEDPRATHLRQMSRELGQRAGQPAVVRDVAAHRGAGESRKEPQPERRFLLGDHLLLRSASRSICSRRSLP